MVYDPCSDELFQAVRGFGSFVNGNKASTSGCGQLDNAVVVRERCFPPCFPPTGTHKNKTTNNKKVVVVSSVCVERSIIDPVFF